ncbi:hypothetical protein LTR53_011463 [Teratosphaeriaceae sp. CCFEE 6253]|nr:hypothetical protein LTR53_011463 [Teratosphaeriaceae sp. CCFEE 6253]
MTIPERRPFTPPHSHIAVTLLSEPPYTPPASLLKPSSTMSSADSESWTPDRQIWLILAGQSCCVFVVCLDATIFSASLPTVAAALHADAVSAYWFITAYLLASAVVQPLTAALADVFGRRATFFSSLVVFTAGTGLGGGGILSVNLIILSDLLPMRQRAKYVGIVQLINSLATTFGSLVGAGLIKASWRWLFYVNFPFCGVGLAIVPFLLRYVSPKTTFYDQLGSIDWVGCAIFILGATSFLLGLSWGGNSYAWSSAATLVPLLAGVAALCFCVYYERHAARNPFLRLSVFGSRSAIAAYVCTILASMTLFVELYFVVLYLLTIKGYTPVVSSTVLLALAGSVVPVSGITGALITKLGGYRWAVFCGWLVNTFALGALMVLDAETYLPGMIFLFVVAGIGQGLLFMAHQVVAQASCPAADMAYASAMFSFCRSLGFCLGVALGGTAFQNFLRRQLILNDLSPAIADNAEGYATILREMPDTWRKYAIADSYVYAFRYLFATMAGISAVGLALSFFVGEHSLDVKQDSSHKLRSKEMLSSPGSPTAMPEKRTSGFF